MPCPLDVCACWHGACPSRTTTRTPSHAQPHAKQPRPGPTYLDGCEAIVHTYAAWAHLADAGQVEQVAGDHGGLVGDGCGAARGVTGGGLRVGRREGTE